MRSNNFLKYILLLGIFALTYLLLQSIKNPKKIDIKNAIISRLNDWQPVTGSKFKFNVYSAYCLLDQTPTEVIVIGTTKTFTTESVDCQFYYWDKDTSSFQIQSRVPGTIETDSDHVGFRYSGVFVKCPLPYSKPEFVSVLMENTTKSSNMMEIQYKSEPRGSQKYNHIFSVCVFPTYSYNEVFHFLEWVEFYNLMGVEHFTFYNISIGPDTSCLINNINKDVDNPIKFIVHPWHKNPIKNFSEIRSGPNCAECALSAASNDCLFRHRGQFSKYLIIVDLDEFIMPREKVAGNYSHLVDLLDSGHRHLNIGEYLFRNGFFVRARPDDPIILERCSNFRNSPMEFRVCRKSFIMSKVYREAYQPYSVRSKYIIKPERVRRAGTHCATSFEAGYVSVNVPEDIAFLRHYRHYKKSQDFQIDRIPVAFGSSLVRRLAEKVEYYMDKCKLSLREVFK